MCDRKTLQFEQFVLIFNMIFFDFSIIRVKRKYFDFAIMRILMLMSFVDVRFD